MVRPERQLLWGAPVRGLTLTRPWPWAFEHAGKRVENRGWAPPAYIIGGTVALHAALGFDYGALEKFVSGQFGVEASKVPTDPKAHPAGVVFALARVRGHYMLDAGDRNHDRWAFGPEVWQLPEYISLPEPVPCRGYQKLWKLPPDVFDAVREQVMACSR